MNALPDLQRRFARTLADDEAVAADDAAAAARIAVYRNTIRANYRQALRATYPVVCALTAAPFFHAAVDAFAVAHPSRGGDLNVYGAEFGDFLDTYPHARDLPYLAGVARLEWAIDEAQRAADPSAAPDELLVALAAIPLEGVAQQRFALDASCRLLDSTYPVLRIWQVHQPDFAGEPDVDFDAPQESLLVRRDAGAVAIERIDAGEFAWLLALLRGETLGTALDAALAADEAFAFERTLRDRIADRTLTRLRAS
jgi:hypothetical protein